MKNLYFITLVLLASINSIQCLAAVLTVSNIPTPTIAQFNNLQAAVNAAASGDTILVNGSLNQYAGCTVNNKRLTILGPGWGPNQLINQYNAIVQGITLTGSGCTLTEIQGLNFVGDLTLNSNAPDSIRIIRNRFSGSGVVINQGYNTYRNYIFEGNYFGYVNQIYSRSIMAVGHSVYLSFVFRNNVFFVAGFIFGNEGAIVGFNNIGNSVLFDHNIWHGPETGQTFDAFDACSFIILTNNIFIRRNPNISNSTFAHNLTFQCSNNTPWTANNNTNSAGNISNTNPQMGSQSTINTGGGNSNNPLLDFTISTGPANDAGLDGKDLGLLFDSSGPLNWANSRNSRLPRVYEMTITNPVVPAGGNLNINLVGKTSN